MPDFSTDFTILIFGSDFCRPDQLYMQNRCVLIDFKEIMSFKSITYDITCSQKKQIVLKVSNSLYISFHYIDLK